MHLLPCNPPQGSLERAPCTSLSLPATRVDSPEDRWEGFWRVADERYYTRCIRADGSEHWYRIDDERATRVLQFPLASVDTRRTVMVGRYGQRSILVRTARVSRRARGTR